MYHLHQDKSPSLTFIYDYFLLRVRKKLRITPFFVRSNLASKEPFEWFYACLLRGGRPYSLERFETFAQIVLSKRSFLRFEDYFDRVSSRTNDRKVRRATTCCIALVNTCRGRGKTKKRSFTEDPNREKKTRIFKAFFSITSSNPVSRSTHKLNFILSRRFDRSKKTPRRPSRNSLFRRRTHYGSKSARTIEK